MKNLRKVVALILAGLFCITVFTGCGPVIAVYDFMEDTKAKNRVKEVLLERYGEEFVVKDVWGFQGNGFQALSYPKRDDTLLFEGLYNFEESPYIYDHYDEAIIAKELKEMVQPDLKELFGDCYVFAVMMSNSSEMTDVEEITIENYVATAKDPSVFIKIGVNVERYKNENYINEYLKIVNSMKKINNLGIGVTVYTHYLPLTNYKRFSNHFQNDVRSDSRFDEIVDDYLEVGMAVIDGDARQTYEEYLSERKELSK